MANLLDFKSGEEKIAEMTAEAERKSLERPVSAAAPVFDARPIEEQRGILPPSGPDALESFTPFNPPTSIDRKYGGKHSQYRAGMPIGLAGRGEGHPGTELPAMVLPDEPGYEEEDPIV